MRGGGGWVTHNQQVLCVNSLVKFTLIASQKI